MPPRRGRPRKGDRRIDAAIDRFKPMGYAECDIRGAVTELLKAIEAAPRGILPVGWLDRMAAEREGNGQLYGGASASAWRLLEEGSYQVVQDKLFDKEEEEKKKENEKLLLEGQENEKQEQPLLLEGQQGEEEPPQHQESAVDEAVPEHRKSIFQVHDEVPADTEAAREEVGDPMFIEPPPINAVVPQTVSMGTGRTRRPCYGWLSESEDEEEL
ncbi:hypothetical protein HU200_032192 [Digitaria exilis]|uniref:WIYLD domain-containing protein n=1 Tax=Digitaria exilis TaxID=1010633 RepID=A0A835BNI2_9POAL|nr:hypothetical protein HU200_032192 [Digitaria exilis]CAB3487326.1 unnamed protein product [Digitaria exilis]